MNAPEKLYLLVRTLNMNDDNEEKCYGISTYFIIKLTDSFFIIIVENDQQMLPWEICITKKSSKLTCLYVPMYLQLDDYHPYSDKKPDIFETHIKKTRDILLDIKIILHKINWLLGFWNLVGKCFFLNL